MPSSTRGRPGHRAIIFGAGAIGMGVLLIALALSGTTIEIPQAALVLSSLSIKGSMAYTAEDNNQVIRYIAEGCYDPTPVISHHFAQEDAAEAFETAVNHKDLATKVIIDVHPD